MTRTARKHLKALPRQQYFLFGKMPPPNIFSIKAVRQLLLGIAASGMSDQELKEFVEKMEADIAKFKAKKQKRLRRIK